MAQKIDSEGNPVLPRMITHVGDGGTSLTNRDISADLARLDVNLSRASIGAVVQPQYTLAEMGANFVWEDAGTPVPAGSTITILEVSGWGALHDLFMGLKNNTDWTRALVSIDGNDVLGEDRSGDLGSFGAFLGSKENDAGIYQIVAELGSPTRRAVRFNLGKDNFCRFASSCNVYVKNFHASDDRRVVVCLFYALGASRQFKVEKSRKADVHQTRQDLASKLGIDPELIVVAQALYSDWETGAASIRTTANVHSRLSQAGEDEVTGFLDKLKGEQPE